MAALLSSVRDGLHCMIALAVVAGVGPSDAAAGEVLVIVDGVDASAGTINVALCTRQTFLGESCPYSMSAPAVKGRTEMIFEDVPPAIYGVQVFHDANGNGLLDRNMLGYPLEGFAFGNGVAPTVTAPSFDEAAVEIGEYGGLIAVRMLYY